MILQEKENNCGEIAVRNLISYFYKKEAYGFLKLTNKCTSFKEMAASLKEYGIESEGYAFNKARNLKIFKGPKIILVSKKQRKHFAILYQSFGPFGLIGEVEKGKRVRLLKKIDQESLNRALIIKSFTKKEVRKPELIRFKEKFLLVILGIISFLGGLVGLYGMKEMAYSYFLPLGAFIILLTEWMEKAEGLLIGKRISEEVIVPYLALRPLKNDLLRSEELKKDVEVKALRGLSEVVSLVLLLGWLVVSSLSELSLVISSLLAYIIVNAAFFAYKEKKKEEAAISGEKIFMEEGFKKYNYLQSQKASQEYGELCLFQEALTYFFFGLFALLNGLIENNLEAYSFLSEVIFLAYIGEGLLKPLIQGEQSQSSLKGLLDLNEKIYEVEGIYQKKVIKSKKAKKGG
ncbi:MAG: cysteine peptidase family C39 domain-containing protein [Bacilli bacterium]|jgi:hypothetical protein|nr:cysteine peptidase family C39 domain-containing protein [Bacilli bacterium]